MIPQTLEEEIILISNKDDFDLGIQSKAIKSLKLQIQKLEEDSVEMLAEIVLNTNLISELKEEMGIIETQADENLDLLFKAADEISRLKIIISKNDLDKIDSLELQRKISSLELLNSELEWLNDNLQKEKWLKVGKSIYIASWEKKYSEIYNAKVKDLEFRYRWALESIGELLNKSEWLKIILEWEIVWLNSIIDRLKKSANESENRLIKSEENELLLKDEIFNLNKVIEILKDSVESSEEINETKRDGLLYEIWNLKKSSVNKIDGIKKLLAKLSEYDLFSEELNDELIALWYENDKLKDDKRILEEKNQGQTDEIKEWKVSIAWLNKDRNNWIEILNNHKKYLDNFLWKLPF